MPLSAERIVNLWLYGVFSHADLKGQNSRIEFERAAKTYGAARLEMVFRMTVQSIGKTAVPNLLRVARPTLARWEKDYGVRPQFTIGTPFGKEVEEVDDHGWKIIRRSSTEFQSNESDAQRLTRILSRAEFGNLKAAVEHTSAPNGVLVSAILSSQTFPRLLEALGFQLITAEDVDIDGAQSRLGGPDSPRAISRREDPSSGLVLPIVVESDGSFHTTAQAAEHYDLKLSELRALILPS